jgi:cytochrome c553
MTGFAAQLKEDDLQVIADYFSKQSPKLETEARPYTSLGKRP